MESSTRKLQITLHSGKGLTDVKIFGTMDPYAVVWIAGDGKQSNPSCKTKTAKKGASCPVWESYMEFNVGSMNADDNCTLFCNINHAGKLFDREIGNVQVPFRDLLAGGDSGEKVSYPVTNFEGKVEGEIILSYTFFGGSSAGKNYGTGGPGKKVQVQPKKKDGTGRKVAGGPGKTVQPEKKDGTGCKVAGGPGKTVQPEKKDGTGGNVAGGPGKKVQVPVQDKKKKKDGTVKRVAKKMVKQVAAEVATAAVVGGILLAVGVGDESVPSVEDEDGGEVIDGVEYQAEEGDVDGADEDIDGEEGDVDGEEYVDQEEDVDQEEYEDEEGDVDLDEENEDEEGDVDGEDEDEDEFDFDEEEDEDEEGDVDLDEEDEDEEGDVDGEEEDEDEDEDEFDFDEDEDEDDEY